MSGKSVSPKPLTGRKVFFLLVAFFGVVIGVNLVMMRFAIETLPGTEVDSAYSASLAYEKEIAAAREQNLRNWRIDAHVQRGPDGGATLQVEARDTNGRPMSGLKFQGRFERPADKRADQPVALAETGIGIYRGTASPIAAGAMGSRTSGRRGGAAGIPVAKSRAVELERDPSCRRCVTSHTTSGTPVPACPTSILRSRASVAPDACPRSSVGLSSIPDVTLARVNLTDRRVALEWREGALDPARFIDRLAELGYKAYPFETVRAEAIETEQASFLLRCLGVAAFAAMNVMMLSVPVWSGNVTDMIPEQRDFFHWLSALIALPAAAYSGQPFFISAFRALRARRTNMDVPISIGIVLALAMSVVETFHHAEHAYFDAALMLITFLVAGRYLDQSMRRRTRAVAGNLAALKAETATKFVGADEICEVPIAAVAGRRHRLVASGRTIRRRRRRDRGAIQDRSKPDHRRNHAGQSGARHRRLCGNAQSVRRIAGAGVGGGRRHAAGGDYASARKCGAGALPLSAIGGPGVEALRPGRACRRVPDDDRVGGVRRVLA